MPPHRRLDVIVPVHDDPRALRRCLQALGRQSALDALRVTVVDNASTEDIAGVVRDFPFADVIHESRRGSYHARNAGLAHTAAPVIAFTDADCLPEPDWAERALQLLGDGGQRTVLAGAVEVFARSDRPTAAELYDLVQGFPQERYVRELGFGVTANLVVPRRAVEAAGGFDGELESGGDVDWCRRATAAGFALRYDDRLRVRHPARVELRELTAKSRRVTRGKTVLSGARGRGAAARHAALELRRALVDIRDAGADPRLVHPRARLRHLTAVFAVRLAAAAEWTRMRST